MTVISLLSQNSGSPSTQKGPWQPLGLLTPLHQSLGDRRSWAILSGLVGLWAQHIEPSVLTSRASLTAQNALERAAYPSHA